jgi:hypothetical protein
MPILLDMKQKAGADSWEGQVARTATAPQTTGSIGAAKKPGDEVGDICLLGDVARLAH